MGALIAASRQADAAVDAELSMHCSDLQRLLDSRSESVVGGVLLSLPVPVTGLAIVRSEAGLVVHVAETVVCCELRTRLKNYVRHFADRLPQLSLEERLEVLTRRHMQRCMSGSQSLPAKHRQLMFLGWLRLWFLQRQNEPAARLRQQQAWLSCLLHEPEKRVRRLWREHLVWFHFNYARRLLHLENRSGGARYLETFVWPDKDDYLRAIHDNGASRVLLSIHMGDFFGAFRILSAVSDTGRRVISLRRDRDRDRGSDNGMQHFSADRVSHQVYYHDQQKPAAIVAALRSGRHTLATLFDLKDDFGNTVVVEFFGQRARFVKGPAQLAILGRSRIFPFVCFEHHGRPCIEMAPVIDTRLRPGESLHQGTKRITQTLVALAEMWIRRWPAQWKYLPLLPTYFEIPQRHE